MQDFIFATFLYVAMICFVCCLRYQPSYIYSVATKTDEPQPASINQIPKTEPERKPEAPNALIETEAHDSQPKSLSTDYSSQLTVLDPSKLTLRQCRAVIREINKGLPKQDRIRQKINGKDAPADWLRGQIARYLETHPDEVMAMEKVLKAC
jgi:hypothetical protein